MFFHRKPDWRHALKDCDHALAGSALMHYLSRNSPSRELAAALEVYFGNPSYHNALGVVEAEPELIMVFRECRPGGVFHRFKVAP
jgi:hypothetical protein